MGILDRISMIVKSNVNDMLDKASNPRVALEGYIYEMGDGIKQAEQGVQDTAVQIKMLQSNANEARKQASQWEQRAEQAVRAGRDDLATEALRQKMKYEQQAESYETQYHEQEQNGQQLRANLEQLKTKYAELQQNKGNLIARYEMGKLTNKVMGERDLGTGLNQGDYSRMERKIMAEMARAEMDTPPGAEAQAELDKMATESHLDDELAALKAKMGHNKPKE